MSVMTVWALIDRRNNMNGLVSIHATEELAWAAFDKWSMVAPDMDLDVSAYTVAQ
jgi:hypothetical protein